MHARKPEGNPSAHGIYLEAIAKAKANKNIREKQEQAKNKIKVQASEEEEKKCDIPVKTSINPLVLNTILPFTNFILMDQCPKCSRFLHTEEIISGWRRSYNDYTTKCHGSLCGNEFVARFKTIFISIIFMIDQVQSD